MIKTNPENLEEAKNIITSLQDELTETNQGIVALTLELDHLKEKLIEKEKLATMGKLAVIFGPELRNPLAVISNSTYYLGRKLQDKKENVLKHVNYLKKEVKVMNKLITDLLNFTQMKKMIFKKIDLNFFIHELLADVEVPENITIDLQLDINLHSINGDSILLQQAFNNIIINAIQAMPEGGTLVIITVEKDEFIEITFADTGVGIPKKDLKNIFKPLFSTKVIGIGLGLTLVKNIINRHFGKIVVKSKIGVGSTFIIKLPIN